MDVKGTQNVVTTARLALDKSMVESEKAWSKEAHDKECKAIVMPHSRERFETCRSSVRTSIRGPLPSMQPISDESVMNDPRRF
jgi:hypothetical protein